jgi:hypothetical protein
MEFVATGRPAAAPARSVARLDAADAIGVPLFGSAMFLSGFLLFLVEPMIARMVLPILGGVPMVWNGCVVFFQIAMLAGYGYAFAASRRLPLRLHLPIHAALLATPAFVLPVLIRAGAVAPPSGQPLAWLLVLLSRTIGLPFFVLSTTASVLQHWLSRTDHPSGRDPYFLYAASNAGCLLALAAYPTLVEPHLTLGNQAGLWTAGYGVFAVLAAACGLYAVRRERPAGDRVEATAATPAVPLTLGRRLRWVGLAFIPSSLMLAVTSYISTDVAAVPLLWIVPLSLYLLTFTIAFGRWMAPAASITRRVLPLVVVPLALFMVAGVHDPLTAMLLLHLGGFAVIALACHGELAADRPDASRLTEFYFWLSFGGMLGGLFNALVAPHAFNSVAEYPLVLLAGCLLLGWGTGHNAPRWRTAFVPTVVAVATAAALLGVRGIAQPRAMTLAMLAVPAVLAFSQRRDAMRFGWSVAAMLAAGLAFGNPDGRLLFATRTFFGVYRVVEDSAHRYHGLAHGTTLHGLQSLDPARRGEALTYFHSTGPFGDAWRVLPSASGGRQIAVVGLGIGTLATYATPDQHWTFFEIDPAIETIARTAPYFTFLQACGSRCTVVAGDARMSLSNVPERSYDLIVLDAFSSDSIPVHLMTREALDLYLSRLTPGGSLVMHVSNRHLRLAPIIGRLALDRGLFAARRVELTGAGWPEGKNASDWIAMSRTRSDITPLIEHHGWQPLTPSPSTPLWTDDFSNILSVLGTH